MPWAAVGRQNLPVPLMRACRLAAVKGAWAPECAVGRLLLLMLLGDGVTLVVGVVFCALAMVALVSNAAPSATAVTAFIALTPREECTTATGRGSAAFRSGFALS